MKKRLALFDFDGTITTKDTFFVFIRFYHGSFKFLVGFVLLSPVLVLHLLKLIPNWRAKEIVLTWFFKGESITNFNQRCQQFTDVVQGLVRGQARSEIQKHKDASAEIFVVSASPEYWVKPWCDQQGIRCLATRLEVADEKLTGKILGRNCYGPEKENRIREALDLSSFDSISAYGDSSGDREMLALAHERFFKPFRG